VLACYSLYVHYRKPGHELSNEWFLASDIAIMMFILFETFADMIVMSCAEYWSSLWHILDFCIVVVCIAMIFVEFTNKDNTREHDGQLGMALLVMRYSVQGLRVVWLMRNAQRAKENAEVVDETAIIMPGRPSLHGGPNQTP
jgi:hypothetical protein